MKSNNYFCCHVAILLLKFLYLFPCITYSLASALKIKYFYSYAHVDENLGGAHSGDYEIDLVELDKNLSDIINNAL